jgi:Ssp1 endopeptidase immunity protein Rap1a
VTETEFPPRTVRDLIEICSPAKDDPMMTAAINYCHGFAQGAVLVEEAHEGQPSARKLFCLPSPQPAEGSEITKFIAWANALPSRLDEPAIDGMFVYLAETYPCPQQAARKPRAR